MQLHSSLPEARDRVSVGGPFTDLDMISVINPTFCFICSDGIDSSCATVKMTRWKWTMRSTSLHRRVISLYITILYPISYLGLFMPQIQGYVRNRRNWPLLSR